MKSLVFRSRKKHCPHSNLRGIYGDEINQHRFRLECVTCGRLLDGPVSLADKRSEEIPLSELDYMDRFYDFKKAKVAHFNNRIKAQSIRRRKMSLLDKMIEDQENAHDEDSYGDQDEFWNYGEDRKYQIVQSEMYDQRRWVTVYRDIVTHEDFPDEYVEVMYERGSTEMQEGDRDRTTFTRVVPHQVVVTKYLDPEE